MDLGAAVVTLVVGAVAVLPRIPSLSADGRRVARLKADADLAATLPPGSAKEALDEHVEAATRELLEARRRPQGYEYFLSVAAGFLVGACLAGALAEALRGESRWLAGLVLPLQGVVLGCAVVSLSILAGLAVRGTRQVAAFLRSRWQRWRIARHTSPAAA